MKVRIISATVAIALLAVVVYLGSQAIGAAVFIIALIGIYEFYRALEKGGYKPVYSAGFFACLPLLYIAFSGMLPDTEEVVSLLNALAIGLFALMVFLFCLLIFSNGKFTVADISVTLLGIIYVVFLFSFLPLTRNLWNGYLYIWLIFIGAWATDTFAYFIGISIGRTKILPRVSPNKSLEGCIGGVLGSILAMLVFGLYFFNVLNVPLYHFAILGVLCGVISQIGDWAASAVKRAMSIKDYGKIMPGHGGVLDRLDSVMFVAPVVYFYIIMFF